MSKILQTVLAETPLVKNLKVERYLKIILNGKATLAKRFQEIEAIFVREKLTKTVHFEGKLSKSTKKLLSDPEFSHQLGLPKLNTIAA